MKRLWLMLAVATASFALGQVAWGKTVVAMQPLSASGDLAKEQQLISEILQSELSTSDKVMLVERENLDKALKEMRLGDQGMLTQESAIQLGKVVGAKYFCYGSLKQSGGDTIAIVKITDIETTITKLAYAKLPAGADVVAIGKTLAGDIVKLIAAFEEEKAKLVAAAPQSERKIIPPEWKRPVVMVVIPEMHVRQPVLIDPAAETEIVKRLLADKFTVKDSEYTVMMAKDPKNAEGIFSSRKTTADYTAKQGVDILLYGEAISEIGTQLDDFKGCRARVELKAIDTKTGNILVSDSAHGGATDLAETVAGKKALQKAANTLCDAFLYRLAETWNQR